MQHKRGEEAASQPHLTVKKPARWIDRHQREREKTWEKRAGERKQIRNGERVKGKLKRGSKRMRETVIRRRNREKTEWERKRGNTGRYTLAHSPVTHTHTHFTGI